MFAGRHAVADLTATVGRRARRQWRLGLALKLGLAFVGLVSLVLAIDGALEMWLGYRAAERTAIDIQLEKARDAAFRIEEFVTEIEHQIGWTTLPQWDALPLEQRRYDFIRLLREVPAITSVAEIDSVGQEQLKLSRTAPDLVAGGADYSADPGFVAAEAKGVWFSPVEFRNQSEPYMRIAVAHAGRHAGVTLVEVNLKFIWDLVTSMQVGQGGYAYVVDRRGRLIADPDLSLVLRDTDWSHRPQVAAALASLHGGPERRRLAHRRTAGRRQSADILRTGAAARVDRLCRAAAREALAPVYAALYLMAGLLVLGLLIAVGLGALLARRMVVPIRRLQDGADRLGSGERGGPIEIHTGDEIEILAERFNQMAAKIQESHDTLEAKVEARTEALQASEQTAREARLAAEKALGDLRQAQDRLVETQKLAALGQLTAGIAHEIKNPLNFVNNFAELSGELTREIQEALAGDKAALSEQARAEIEDLIGLLNGNLARIAEHGRRADSIVKNMLMHSRTGSGERRQADVNALVEEALNLAYHGARAEHPDFNVTLERDLDPAAGALDLYPQEMSRVLLNLFANGLYAVRQRQRAGAADYAPAVSVATHAPRRPGRNPRSRQRHRHSRSGAGKDLRPVLYHQARRRRDRPRPVVELRYCRQAARRRLCGRIGGGRLY